MGLCMVVRKTGEEFSISYGAYFCLRVKILETLDEELGADFKGLGFFSHLSESSLKKLSDLNLYDFMMHSDCDGILKLATIKKTFKCLENLELKDKNWQPELELLKHIFRQAIKANSSIKYC